MSEKIVVYGAGGLGRESAVLVEQTLCRSGAELVGFIDDGAPPGTEYGSVRVLGGIDRLLEMDGPLGVVIAIADPRVKKKIVSRLSADPRFFFPNVIHPRAVIEPRATIGCGALFAIDAYVSVDAAIGDFVFLNYRVTVGHDAVIGSFCSVMPTAAISGCVELGEGCLAGVASSIRQGTKVGSWSTIGMGAVVVRDVAEGSTVIGNPAREIKK